jgi:two-component system phosphate regulon sensor histidine kinase PhoR
VTFGVRGRLVAASVLLLAVIGLTSGLWLETRLRDNLETRIEAEVQRLTTIATARIQAEPGASSVAEYDRLADELGDSMNARVTVISAGGGVLGDSRVPRDEVASLDDHLTRPEIRDAFSSGIGVARRYSSTVDDGLLYVAQRLERDPGEIVVRVAVPLADVDEAVWTLRVRLMGAGLIGLLVVLLMSTLAGALYGRTLSDLVERSRMLATRRDVDGEFPGTGDELGRISTSIDQIGDDMEGLVQTLVNERDRFLAVLEGMESAVIAIDADRTISVVNSAARSMLDMRENPVGRSLVEAVRIPALVDLAKSDIPKTGTEALVELVGPPARVFQVRATSARVTGGTVLVLNDITEIKRLETIRQDFVANVSHELRTPVSVIHANAETLLDGAIDDKEVAKEFTSAILRNAERLSNLVSDLLDLARIEAGSYALERELVQVHQCVVRAFESVERKARKKGIELINEVSPEFVLGADISAMEQVLVNLVENAVKYGREGGHVWVRIERGSDAVRIEIVDDGPGISPQHRERLFERFYRVDTGRSRAEGGTGLGLAIVKHLVNAMGLEIGMRAREPHGCIFSIESQKIEITVAS